MASESCAHQSFCVNTPVDSVGELDELAGTQDPARRSNNGSNKIPTKALIPLEAPIPPFVPPSTEDLFTRFMKVFKKTTQAQTLAELRKCPLKDGTMETYYGKSHMDCYHFCQ